MSPVSPGTPATVPPPLVGSGAPDTTLYRIARLHWWMNICLPLLLVVPYFLLRALGVLISRFLVNPTPDLTHEFLVFVAWALVFLALNFWALTLSLRMAACLWGGFAFAALLALLIWIPWINFIVLLVLSIQGGSRLRSGGVRMGLMGVPRAERARLKAALAVPGVAS